MESVLSLPLLTSLDTRLKKKALQSSSSYSLHCDLESISVSLTSASCISTQVRQQWLTTQQTSPAFVSLRYFLCQRDYRCCVNPSTFLWSRSCESAEGDLGEVCILKGGEKGERHSLSFLNILFQTFWWKFDAWKLPQRDAAGKKDQEESSVFYGSVTNTMR